MRHPLGQRGDTLLEGGQTRTERAELMAHLPAQVAQVCAQPGAEGDNQGRREPRHDGFHANTAARYGLSPRRSAARTALRMFASA